MNRSAHLPCLAAAAFAVLICCFSARAPGAIIGTNPPSQPLTLQRIAALPREKQADWQEYLKRSEEQQRADQAFLQKEMRALGLKQTTVPPDARLNRQLPLNRPDAWYGDAAAREIADNIVSFQTPAGGWTKNLNMTTQRRAPGMHFAPNNTSRFLGDADFDEAVMDNWSYVGTFDNDATTMQLRFLAKVIAATDLKDSEKYRAAFLRGVDYTLAAQYPNGGWPQVWPLQGGYHDAVTYNDNTMANILNVLREVAGPATNRFAFVPSKTRAHAAVAFQRGIECLLATQVVAAGRPTIWCQQYDALTLRPASARNYEMPSLAAGESAGIMMFLMQLPEPDLRIVDAVHAAAAWFEKNAIRDVAFRSVGNEGRLLVPSPGSGPLWARYYEIGTDRPLFGDRDKTIHDTVEEISRERRTGYAWYVDGGSAALERYARWRSAHPAARN